MTGICGHDEDPRTLVSRHYSSSPEIDYFRAPPPNRRQTSRWKEDWEELELLVRSITQHISQASQYNYYCRAAELSVPSSRHATKLTPAFMQVRNSLIVFVC